MSVFERGTGKLEITDKERIARLEAKVAALKETAKEYSYNSHFPSCKINNEYIRRCSCGYAELAALVETE